MTTDRQSKLDAVAETLRAPGQTVLVVDGASLETAHSLADLALRSGHYIGKEPVMKSESKEKPYTIPAVPVGAPVGTMELPRKPLKPAEPPSTVLAVEAAQRKVHAVRRDYNAQVTGLQDSYTVLVRRANVEAADKLTGACKEKDRTLAELVKVKADVISHLKSEEEKELKRTLDAVRGKFARMRELETGRIEAARAAALAKYDETRKPVEEDLTSKLANLKSWVDGEIATVEKLYGENCENATRELDAAKLAEAVRQAGGEPAASGAKAGKPAEKSAP